MLYGYQFGSKMIYKLPKMRIDLGVEKNSLLLPDDVYVASMYVCRAALVSDLAGRYGELYCIHTHAARQQIVLYSLTRERIVKEYAINHTLSGRNSVSVVDNCIVVHDLHDRTVSLFDIKMSSRRPVGSPKPLPSPNVASTSIDSEEGKKKTKLQPELETCTHCSH